MGILPFKKNYKNNNSVFLRTKTPKKIDMFLYMLDSQKPSLTYAYHLPYNANGFFYCVYLGMGIGF